MEINLIKFIDREIEKLDQDLKLYNADLKNKGLTFNDHLSLLKLYVFNTGKKAAFTNILNFLSKEK